MEPRHLSARRVAGFIGICAGCKRRKQEGAKDVNQAGYIAKAVERHASHVGQEEAVNVFLYVASAPLRKARRQWVLFQRSAIKCPSMTYS